MRDGFEYFVAARGAMRHGTGSVDMTTAYDARHRLAANPAAIAGITVVYQPGDRIAKDGFAYCVGATIEATGLTSETVGPVTVLCAD
jgi:hypothetical protein